MRKLSISSRRVLNYYMLTAMAPISTFHYSSLHVPMTLLFSDIPPHMTHLLQGLDVVLFSPFKYVYAKHLKVTGNKVNKSAFLSVLHKAVQDLFTKKNILMAWKKTGLQPIDPGIVSEADLAPSKEFASVFTLPLPPPSAICAIVDAIQGQHALSDPHNLVAAVKPLNFGKCIQQLAPLPVKKTTNQVWNKPSHQFTQKCQCYIPSRRNPLWSSIYTVSTSSGTQNSHIGMWTAANWAGPFPYQFGWGTQIEQLVTFPWSLECNKGCISSAALMCWPTTCPNRSAGGLLSTTPVDFEAQRKAKESNRSQKGYGTRRGTHIYKWSHYQCTRGVSNSWGVQKGHTASMKRFQILIIWSQGMDESGHHPTEGIPWCLDCWVEGGTSRITM